MGKKLLSLILGTIFAALAMSLFIWDSTGYGMKITRHVGENNYYTVTVNYPFYSESFRFGDYKEFKDDYYEYVEHKRYDSYYGLDHNEQIVYNAILSNARNIWNEETTSTEVIISMAGFDYDKNLSLSEYDSYLNEMVKKIDYKTIYDALHDDYDWLFWWEHNMEWTITSPDLIYTANDISGSTFRISMAPLLKYGEDNKLYGSSIIDMKKAKETINKYVAEINELNNESKFEKIKTIVLDLANYDKEYKNSYTHSPENEAVVKSVLSLFNQDILHDVVCGGYANAFQVLSDLSNVESYKKIGTLNYQKQEEKHAWNVLYINDKAYLADITNSENDTIGHNDELFMKPIAGKEYSVYIKGLEVSYYEN